MIIPRFTRVAFGTAASQFLLASAISKHLSQYEKTDPLFVKKFLENLYVDDSINGANSVEEVRKFHSNNQSLQQKINQIKKAVQPIQNENLKVLGIEWDKFKDTFIIDLHKIFTNGFNSPVTKRNILRLIASIYDPLGIIPPIVVLFKIYFQKLTTLKNNWDADLNLEMSSEWLKLFNSLQFSKFTVQRFYLPSNISLTDRKFDVHGFSDASKNAYAAAVYLACSNYSILLASKTPVSPLQATSIPRLELMASLLLSELIEIVLLSISNSIDIKNVYCWSDSLTLYFRLREKIKLGNQFI